MVDIIQNQPEHEDAQLIQQAKDGDADAFGELYERYAEHVFRFIYSQTSNRLDAEDLTADVFLKSWRSLSNYEERGFSFSAYLFRIARNVLIDSRRRQKPVDPLSEDEIMNLPETMISNPSAMLAKKVQHKELFRIMSQMREDYRTVLVLRFLNDLSPEETSQVMGRSIGAVRVLQHRALISLRKVIPLHTIEN